MPEAAVTSVITEPSAGTFQLPAELAERLELLLGVPAELFLGTPDETTDERLAREDAAADILDADPLLAVRSRHLAEVVGAAYLDGVDVIEFGGEPEVEVVEFPLDRGPVTPAAFKAVA